MLLEKAPKRKREVVERDLCVRRHDRDPLLLRATPALKNVVCTVVPVLPVCRALRLRRCGSDALTIRCTVGVVRRAGDRKAGFDIALVAGLLGIDVNLVRENEHVCTEFHKLLLAGCEAMLRRQDRFAVIVKRAVFDICQRILVQDVPAVAEIVYPAPALARRQHGEVPRAQVFRVVHLAGADLELVIVAVEGVRGVLRLRGTNNLRKVGHYSFHLPRVIGRCVRLYQPVQSVYAALYSAAYWLYLAVSAFISAIRDSR